MWQCHWAAVGGAAPAVVVSTEADPAAVVGAEPAAVLGADPVAVVEVDPVALVGGTLVPETVAKSKH
jgi:hypothetical protein